MWMFLLGKLSFYTPYGVTLFRTAATYGIGNLGFVAFLYALRRDLV